MTEEDISFSGSPEINNGVLGFLLCRYGQITAAFVPPFDDVFANFLMVDFE